MRFEGEPVIAVVAEDPGIAEDALDDIEVVYEPLPPITTAAAALTDDSPLLYEEWGDNILGQRSGTFGDVDAAFEHADLVFSESYFMGRQAALPLESRGTVAQFDGINMQVSSSTKTPHLLRTLMAHVLRMPESCVRGRCPGRRGWLRSQVPTPP